MSWPGHSSLNILSSFTHSFLRFISTSEVGNNRSYSSRMSVVSFLSSSSVSRRFTVDKSTRSSFSFPML